MAEPEINTYSPGNKKVRKILLIIAPVLAVSSLFLIFFGSNMFDAAGDLLMLIVFIDLGIVAWLAKKAYNWPLLFILIIIWSIFCKRERWPLTGLFFSIGFTGLSCFSFYFAAIFLKKYNHNTFLKYIGFSSSIILSIVTIGLLWKIMHWPFANLILNTGLGLYIPFLFAFVFTLPGSNYINWHKSERTVFFRAIIIPMAFVYILVVLMFVFPYIYTSITRTPLIPFHMVQIDLLKKPGLY
jgi:hypothetical protein